jgi:hypothetical protein
LSIFVSAVTNEFGKARDRVRSDLRARGRTVTVQSDFQQDPNSDTLLGTLANYIRDCHAVICIIGKRSGAGPPSAAADKFKDILPGGIKEASYTQCEYFLARHYNRRLYVYIANDDYEPDQKTVDGDKADLQNAYIDFLKAKGVHYTKFSNADELRIAVLRDQPEIAPEPSKGAKAIPKPIVLPYQSIGGLFKGRDEFMARLRASLTRPRGGRTAIVSQALYGLGGIGKTRAAVEYAWANADDYNALLFVVAETPEALRRNLAALSATLTPQLDTTDDAVKIAAVLDWLRTNPGWFLILDNVDSRDALAEVERLLAGLTGGHVIITSRLADFPGDIQPLELNVLAIDDAAAFLLERTRDRRRVAADDEARARVIAQELDGLALALEQAGAFIAERGLTFRQYLDQWRSERDQLLALSDVTATGRPTKPLPSPSPATRFSYVNGRFDTVPSNAWHNRAARAAIYHASARELAIALADRLSKTDAEPKAAATVSALVDILGASVSDVHPDQLRLASRSISAKARAFGHPSAQREISDESVGVFFELADALVDLQAFVRTELEEHEIAIRQLDLTPQTAAEAKHGLDILTDGILAAPELISERVEAAFEDAAIISDASEDANASIAIEGDRTLLTANLALAVAHELDRTSASDADKKKKPPSGGKPPGGRPPEEPPDDEPEEPARRRGRIGRRSSRKAAKDRTWEDFTDRILARIDQKGPDAIGDAIVHTITSTVKYGPTAVAGLGAALLAWAHTGPVLLGGGTLATTVAWIAYQLGQRSKK